MTTLNLILTKPELFPNILIEDTVLDDNNNILSNNRATDLLYSFLCNSLKKLRRPTQKIIYIDYLSQFSRYISFSTTAAEATAKAAPNTGGEGDGGEDCTKNTGATNVKQYLEYFIKLGQLVILDGYELFLRRPPPNPTYKYNDEGRSVKIFDFNLNNLFYVQSITQTPSKLPYETSTQPENSSKFGSFLRGLDACGTQGYDDIFAIYVNGFEFPIIEDLGKTVTLIKNLRMLSAVQNDGHSFTFVCLVDKKLLDNSTLAGLKQLYTAVITVDRLGPNYYSSLPKLSTSSKSICSSVDNEFVSEGMACTTFYNRPGKKPGQTLEHIFLTSTISNSQQEEGGTNLSPRLPTFTFKIKEATKAHDDLNRDSTKNSSNSKSVFQKHSTPPTMTNHEEGDKESRHLRLLQRQVPFKLTPSDQKELDMRDLTHRQGLPHKLLAAQEHEYRLAYEEIKGDPHGKEDIDHEEPLQEPGFDDDEGEEEQDPDNDLYI